MKNALLEAAAEILKNSLATAPKEELHKVEGEVQDLGGDTPTEHSDEKLDVHAKEATPPGKQPGSDTKEPLHKIADVVVIDPTRLKEEKDEEDEDEDEDGDDKKDDKKDDKDGDDKKDDWKKNLKEDVAAILASESGLTKEFQSKIGTIYEARVTDKVQSIQESIEKQYEEKFASAVIEVRDNLTEQVNDYLDYVVEEWMKQNELAIEKGLRSELTEEFIGGLRDLFTEHFIDIPSEKVDLVDELATKVEELTGSLNEEVAKSVELTKQLSESKKAEILRSVCEGLTQTQVEKVRSLAESVEFTAEGDYSGKVSTIRENYFPVATGKKIDAKVLTEASEPIAEEAKAPVVDPDVARVVASITQSLK